MHKIPSKIVLKLVIKIFKVKTNKNESKKYIIILFGANKKKYIIYFLKILCYFLLYLIKKLKIDAFLALNRLGKNNIINIFIKLKLFTLIEILEINIFLLTILVSLFTLELIF